MDNKFYSNAYFHSTEELAEILKSAGFIKFDYWQTLFKTNDKAVEDPQGRTRTRQFCGDASH